METVWNYQHGFRRNRLGTGLMFYTHTYTCTHTHTHTHVTQISVAIRELVPTKVPFSITQRR